MARESDEEFYARIRREKAVAAAWRSFRFQPKSRSDSRRLSQLPSENPKPVSLGRARKAPLENHS